MTYELNSLFLAIGFSVFIAVNLLTLLLFFIDKRRAERGGWRVAERVLLLSALLGGSIGAIYARKKWRHKTRKQPFARRFNAIVTLHVALLCTGLWLAFKSR